MISELERLHQKLNSVADEIARYIAERDNLVSAIAELEKMIEQKNDILSQSNSAYRTMLSRESAQRKSMRQNLGALTNTPIASKIYPIISDRTDADFGIMADSLDDFLRSAKEEIEKDAENHADKKTKKNELDRLISSMEYMRNNIKETINNVSKGK